MEEENPKQEEAAQPKEVGREQPQTQEEPTPFRIKEMSRLIANKGMTGALTFRDNLELEGYREISHRDMLVTADGESYVVSQQDGTKFRKGILDSVVAGFIQALRGEKPTPDRVRKFLANAAIRYRAGNPS